MDEKSFWLWYPGDFERYHAMKQNFSRVERGCGWPAFWKSEGFRNRVAFRRVYTLTEDTSFTVYAAADAVGYVQLDEEKHPFGTAVPCPAGTHRISIHVGCIGCVPSVCVQGEVIRSDPGWTAEDFDGEPVRAAFSEAFSDPLRDPSSWPYAEKLYLPVEEEAVNNGVLYTFETELTAALEVLGPGLPTVYLGESRAEALDTVNCYFFAPPDGATGRLPRQALRYAFVPGCRPGDYAVRAIHQYVDIPVRASFFCDDEDLNRIFAVAAHTFSLCSDVFLLDGVKRDKWIWGGDAWQSLFVNRYLTADREIEKRTLTALRGRDPMTTHINTIADYSLIWILSVETYFDSYGDAEFLRTVLPQMESLMAFCMAQRDEHGFMMGREKDWIFIDWADFDRDGPLCALQMLLCDAYRVMARFSPDRARWESERSELLRQIEAFFWDSGKQAYIDSFRSGKRNVTRHANIFAILFGIADEGRKKLLADSVLRNPDVPAITTPYFRFFELEALCRLGRLDEVLAQIKSYWGGMLKLGAVTFWEEYDPEKPPEAQYEMYGDPYGKSLCHAWAASPIYLLGRYFAGLRPLSPGGGEYEVLPQTCFFKKLDCSFPMGGKLIGIRWEKGALSMTEQDLQTAGER